jgi:hypothetical protein
MLSLKRGTRTDGPERGRRSASSFLAALAVNVLLFAAFFKAATMDARWSALFGREPEPRTPTERIGFVRLPQNAALPPTAGRDGGDGRTAGPAPRTPAPRVRAPAAMPDAVPEAPAAAGGGSGAGQGSGPVVGAGGPTSGISPNYSDPRLWTPPGPIVAAPKTSKQRIDSVIAEGFRVARDSVDSARVVAEAQRKPGDWTVDGPGGKWGWDQRAVRLGKVSIPNALLGLLSQGIQTQVRSNPIENERERRIAQIRADILQHAQREMSEDAFRQAVKDVRRRKDAERAARLAARRQGDENTQASQPAGAATATP